MSNPSDGQQPKTMTREDRLRLIYAPFPVVRATSPLGNSQAPVTAPVLIRKAEEGW